MSGATLRSIMAGQDFLPQPRPRLIARSTATFCQPDGAVVVRLHRTNILTKHFQLGRTFAQPGYPLAQAT